MEADWNPPTPIEDLFEQLRAGATFAMEGEDAPSAPRLVRLGYNIINKTGLFELGCRDWRKKPAADKTFAQLQVHFKRWDRDRKLLATARSAGYHAAHHAVEPGHPVPHPPLTYPLPAALPPAPPAPASIANADTKELAFLREQLQTLTAAMAAASY
eukprot:scaffold15489_cov53-Attheya_sp.AAC.7